MRAALRSGPVLRRLEPGDAAGLSEFYNGLSDPSKRLFRPLREKTDPEQCLGLARENEAEIDRKYDLIAVEDGRIVGWTFLWNLDEPGAAVFGLAVSDARQGRGIGRRLMAEVLAAAGSRGLRTVRLTVVQENMRARGLYESLGFTVTGTTVGPDGLDYYKMEREVRP